MLLILPIQAMNFSPCSVNISFYVRLLTQISLQIKQGGVI